MCSTQRTRCFDQSERGWYEDLLSAACSFLEEPITSPKALGQCVLITRAQLLELVKDVDEASGGDGDESRLNKEVAAHISDGEDMCQMSLSHMLAVIEKAQHPPLVVKQLPPITPQQEKDEADTNAELDDVDVQNAAFVRLARLAGDSQKIDLEELALSLQSAGADAVTAHELMARFDSNGDRALAHDEFERMVAILLSDPDAHLSVKKWSQMIADYPDLQKRSQQWLDKAVQEMMSKAPIQTEPHVVVPYGPPGCGKTGATNAALNQYGIKKEECVEPNIDDLVRSYMQEVTKNEDMFGDQATYFAIRSGWPSKATCRMMEMAIQTKRHVIVETTGRSTWLASNVIEPAAKNGFRTMIVYVLVPLAKIAPRALARKKRTGQGHPPFTELSQTCVKAARNLATFKDAGGNKAIVLFANNAGSYGTLRLMKEMDPDLETMAREEPFCLELCAMLAQQARGKPYTLDGAGSHVSQREIGKFQGLMIDCFTWISGKLRVR